MLDGFIKRGDIAISKTYDGHLKFSKADPLHIKDIKVLETIKQGADDLEAQVVPEAHPTWLCYWTADASPIGARRRQINGKRHSNSTI